MNTATEHDEVEDAFRLGHRQEEPMDVSAIQQQATSSMAGLTKQRQRDRTQSFLNRKSSYSRAVPETTLDAMVTLTPGRPMVSPFVLLVTHHLLLQDRVRETARAARKRELPRIRMSGFCYKTPWRRPRFMTLVNIWQFKQRNQCFKCGLHYGCILAAGPKLVMKNWS